MSIGGVVARLTAVVVAILLVVGAYAWRDSRQGTQPPDGPDATETTPAAVDEVVCAMELRICDHLALSDVTVRSVAGVATADDLVSAPDAPVWITLRSLVDVVEDARDRGGQQPLLTAGDTIAMSPLLIASWSDRAAVLQAACATVSWGCIGDLAEGTWAAAGGQTAWGGLKPALPDPDSSGIGLLVLGQATAAQLGSPTFSAQDLDTPEFQRWLANLGANVPATTGTGGSFMQRMLQFGPATVDIVGTTESEIAELLDRAGARGTSVVVMGSAPTVLAEVVIAAPVGRSAPDDLVEAVTAALVDAGWRTDPAVAPTLLVDSPGVTAEPVTFNGGLLEALRLRWQRLR